MFALLKKQNKRNAKIHFNDEQLKNFKELKRRLCNPPVLHLPDFNKSMLLRTDASKFAAGGVLFQVVDGAERPIAYTSRKMKSAELNYPTQQQELLAIVHALAAFRIYCFDKPPIVETDHKSLEGLFTQKMANRRLAPWYDILAEYQPTFPYLPGAKNGIANALSRRPDLQPETKFFNDLSVTSFDDTSFSLALSVVATDTELATNIKKAYKKDREVQTIFAAIKRRTAEPKTKRVSQHHKKYRCYSEADDFLWYQTPIDDVPRIVVSNDLKLRQTIISECRANVFDTSTPLVLVQDAEVHPAIHCGLRALPTQQAAIAEASRTARTTEHPGREMAIDFHRLHHRSTANEARRRLNLGVVNRLTKRCHFVPTTKTVTAEGVARLFIDNIWKLHGMPSNIVSNRNRKFVSKFCQYVFKSIGTKPSMTVAHRAQGDGPTEIMNRTLEEYLRCFAGPLQDDWDVHLANTEFAINSTVHSSTKLAPFEADLGYIPLNPLQLTAEQLARAPKRRPGAEFHERQAAILLRCREALAEAQKRMRDVYDRNREEQVFDVGERVYLSTKHLDPKHSGLPNSTKFGRIQAGNELHPVFNTGSLKPYKESTRLSQPGDVILADGSVGQIVKRLLGKRRHKRRTQFLVEWVGEEKPTWEPLENLTQIPDLIAEFEQTRRTKRRRR
ncbi:hypothetical protein PR001_g15432 [Phytophthora rubi]|uniref:Chromo domain-containing protein n=1 Tax=Phytophthora rubi TaxID=129364 RepID=A0A6A3L5S5_9STRA|nr:hypothetical protein PR001_g15432 [Phytophthora rubi]